MFDAVACTPVDMILRASQGNLDCSYRPSGCEKDVPTRPSSIRLFKIIRLVRRARRPSTDPTRTRRAGMPAEPSPLTISPAPAPAPLPRSLVKLLRLVRIGRLLTRYEDDLFYLLPALSFMKLLAWLLFVGHLVGCFFFFLSNDEWLVPWEESMRKSGKFGENWVEAGNLKGAFLSGAGRLCPSGPGGRQQPSERGPGLPLTCDASPVPATRRRRPQAVAVRCIDVLGFHDVSDCRIRRHQRQDGR